MQENIGGKKKKMKIEPIQFDEQSPKYLQIYHSLKEGVQAGRFEQGERLPAIRAYAKQLGIHVSTVVHAYQMLETAGYARSKRGSGYYVCVPEKQEKPQINYYAVEKGMIDFANASPNPEVFPTESFKECIDAVLERDRGAAFGCMDSNGYLPLRESIASICGFQEKKENIIMISGSQQGIDVAAKCLLYPGDYVMTEQPTYSGARAVFESRGARCVPVSMEEDGIELIELEKKVRLYKPKLLYLMTRFQNPTAVSYSKEKLEGILRLAQQYGFYVLEDDSMGELSYTDTDRPRVHSMKSLDKMGHVIYLRSFSKLLMPGMRIAFMAVPPLVLEGMTQAKYHTDITSSGLLQRSLDLYIRSGKWEEHKNYMKQIYRGKYEYMLSCLQAIGSVSYTPPGGGLYIWVRVRMDAEKLSMWCREHGLLVLPSTAFDERSVQAVRLSFAYPDIGEINKGMERFKKGLEEIK